MKKIISILLTCFLIMSFIGCSHCSKDPTDSSEESQVIIKAIDHFENAVIDPKDKMVIFSIPENFKDKEDEDFQPFDCEKGEGSLPFDIILLGKNGEMKVFNDRGCKNPVEGEEFLLTSGSNTFYLKLKYKGDLLSNGETYFLKIICPRKETKVKDGTITQSQVVDFMAGICAAIKTSGIENEQYENEKEDIKNKINSLDYIDELVDCANKLGLTKEDADELSNKYSDYIQEVISKIYNICYDVQDKDGESSIKTKKEKYFAVTDELLSEDFIKFALNFTNDISEKVKPEGIAEFCFSLKKIIEKSKGNKNDRQEKKFEIGSQSGSDSDGDSAEKDEHRGLPEELVRERFLNTIDKLQMSVKAMTTDENGKTTGSDGRPIVDKVAANSAKIAEMFRCIINGDLKRLDTIFDEYADSGKLAGLFKEFCTSMKPLVKMLDGEGDTISEFIYDIIVFFKDGALNIDDIKSGADEKNSDENENTEKISINKSDIRNILNSLNLVVETLNNIVNELEIKEDGSVKKEKNIIGTIIEDIKAVTTDSEENITDEDKKEENVTIKKARVIKDLCALLDKLYNGKQEINGETYNNLSDIEKKDLGGIAITVNKLCGNSEFKFKDYMDFVDTHKNYKDRTISPKEAEKIVNSFDKLFNFDKKEDMEK